ncbi:hypothetical protein [Kurthia sp. Dielmo]|uniref:hypothetical protein n=1 Tax=Kurthia sp. Dielmo TaxID=1033738 RepID=UPI001124B660|nr:hypothetical protein [Kurthia sp. Dielmo]
MGGPTAMYAVRCDDNTWMQMQRISIFNSGNTAEFRAEICRQLRANRYAVIHYSDELVILVDELAAYKEHQPIWSICLQNGTQMDIPGTLFFSRTSPTDRGIQLINIRASDIFNIRCFANICFKGWTQD